ncbi:sigma-70 family RNA polymerase sigma factor [Kitasatospora sp. NPDC050543]|uniref:sigma-70 family RNA polymerase sigma factor n=1 Tax=Kitasatospora sp. NPDC050543 TaxID=3364054 RepID=UPI0037A4D106
MRAVSAVPSAPAAPAAPVAPAAPAVAATSAAAPRATLDHDELAELYRLHGPYLLRSVLRVTNGDRGKAEDILQETLLRAWQHPEVMSRGPERSRPWLFTVARRIAIDHLRMAGARAQEVMTDIPEERTAVVNPFDEVLASQDLCAVLARLQPHHREVVVELHLKDRSVADTAVALGVPVGTVKSRNFYAIRVLRKVLAEQDTEPGPEVVRAAC